MALAMAIEEFYRQERERFINALFEGMKLQEFVEIRELPNGRRYFLKLHEAKLYKPTYSTNVYFGVYARAERSGKAEACSTTGVLYADYDFEGTALNERLKEVQERIKKAGLPLPSVLVNSGNGIHAYWLLKNRAGEEALKVIKAIALATGGDVRATDKARIMRLPFTMNVKTDNALWCEIVQADYGLKYDLSDFTKVLDRYIRQEEEKATEGKFGLLEGINPDRYCIAKMLEGVPEGERNFALGRITKWLQIKGYTKEKSRKIIIAWNKRNNPSEDEKKLLKDFEYYWHGDYKLLGCMIDNPELQQILYKYCNKPECPFTEAIGGIKLDNHVKYNNRLLNQLDELTGNDLIIYGVLLRHSEGLTTSLLIEKLTSKATGKTCMTKKTMLKSIKVLRQRGFIEVLEGNKRAGKENFYKAKAQGTYGLGYTLVSNGAINGAVDGRITPAEFKLYILLQKYAFNKGNAYPSLRTLAKELKVGADWVSKALKRLEQADYIKRYYKVQNGVEKLFIKLLV